MKRGKWNAVILVSALMVALSLQSAGAYDWRAGFDLNITDPQANLDSRYSTEYGVHFRNEVMFNSYLGFSAGIGYRDFQRNSHGDDADLSIANIYIDGVGAYPFLEKWRGFVELGMGVYIWEADRRWWEARGSGDSADLGFNFGSGITYAVTDQIELFSRISQHRVKFDKSNEYSKWLEYALGVQFRIF